MMQLLQGDCLELIRDIDPKSIHAIVSDPPYGADNDCDYTRFSGGKSPSRRYHKGIAGDDQPFDPSPWLGFPKVILWGYQFFAERVPQGTVLVWNKKRPNQLGTFLSDCELAWQKGGKGVYLFNHPWHGFDRASERGQSLHPSQKPVELMAWCIKRLNLPEGATILDPYMGTGATGVAAKRLGYQFIGIEQEREYFQIAQRRIMATPRQFELAI
jgi:site-specific DNA-methyltransferase (adenine-specific)